MDTTYLDNNATTRLAPEAFDTMLPYLRDWYGNPSSVHRLGQRSRQAIDESRASIADLLGCADNELLFTSGGTEAINTAIRGLLATRSPRQKIITTTVEHSATRELCQQLAREGYFIVEIPVDVTGALDVDQFAAELAEDVALVSIMWANNETGVLFPIEQLAAMCREKRVPMHCDAVQAIGKIPVNFKSIGVDLASFAAHKFHGPKGVGGLYVRRGVRFRPLVIGGPQERNRRGGTENVAGIVGAAAAAKISLAALSQMSRVSDLRDRLERGILSTIEDAHVNGRADARLPNTTNIGFSRLEAEAILLLLSEQGICASAGAACSSGSLEPSHVLRAMRIDARVAHGAVRFSLSRFSTDADVDRALEVLPRVIAKLRAVLPVSV